MNLVIHHFTKIANESPDKIAISLNDRSITYKELNHLSNQAAAHFQNNGVQLGDGIGILAAHSIELIAIILGLYKIGAYFVPIAPELPKSRQEYILDDSDSKMVICDKAYSLPESVFQLSIKSFFTSEKEDYKPVQVESSNTAYIIYTSGTTGNPKGVILTQENLIHYLLFAVSTYLKEDAVFALFTPLSFDLTITSLFSPLISGKKITIYNSRNTAKVLNQMIQERKVNTLKLTPSHLLLLNNIDLKNSAFHTLIVGGEALAMKVANEIQNQSNELRIFNEYGPTEATVGCMYSLFSKHEKGLTVSIGKAVPYASIYLLDKNGNEIKKEGRGELVIAGKGLARGYLNRLKLSRTKFQIHPKLNKRIYFSGDIAYRDENGNVYFQGRIDDQVKISGYRIELSEIESVCEKVIQDDRAFILVEENEKGIKELICYLPIELQKTIRTPNELIQKLQKNIPNYMVPSGYYFFTELPLTTNGKLDKTKLQQTRISFKIKTIVLPTENKTIRKLIEIWGETLQVSSIKKEDSFFELGGNSLQLISLNEAINRKFNSSINLEELFDATTIQEQETLLLKKEKTKEEEWVVDLKQTSFRLTDRQRQLFFLQKITPKNTSYNEAFCLSVKDYSQKQVMDALLTLTQSHQVLQVKIGMHKGSPQQSIDSSLIIPIEIIENKVDSYQEYIVPHKFQNELAWRAFYFKGNNEILFDIHHIISDGWSEKVFINDFYELLNEGNLLYKTNSYTQFLQWQFSPEQLRLQNEQETFWANILKDEYSKPILPHFGKFNVSKKIQQSFIIDEKLHRSIQTLSIQNNVSVFHYFLASFYLLIHEYSQEKDFIIGVPVSGRTRPEFMHTIGMMINVLPMRLKIDEQQSLEIFVKTVGQTALKYLTKQQYPFLKMVEKFESSGNKGNPFFDTMLVYQDQSDECLYDYNKIKTESKLPLLLEVIPTSKTNAVHLNWEFESNLFSCEQIAVFQQQFVLLLQSFVNTPTLSIQELDLHTNENKNQLDLFQKGPKVIFPTITIIDQFREMAKNQPKSIAVRMNNEQLTYQELDQLSDIVAGNLNHLLLDKKEVIGLMGPRSIDFISCMFGILKSGNTYLPILESLPLKRKEYILEDSNAAILLCDNEDDFHTISSHVLHFSQVVNPIYEKKMSPSPADRAYIIYTSGSTGNPKGVQISHQSMINRLFWHQDAYPLEKGDKIIHKTAISFDVSISELFLWCVFGGELVLLGVNEEKYPEKIANCIAINNINFVHMVPTMLNSFTHHIKSKQLQDKLISIKYLVASGESLPLRTSKETLELLKQSNPKAQLVNLYGPTEATVDVSHHLCREEDLLIPIGKPIANTSLLLLDKSKKQSINGAIGEIYIGGSNVGIGYLNKPEITKDSYIRLEEFGNERFYKTGDLGRWLPNGEIEYLGRNDHQLKIRGYRIELGEIENTLQQILPNAAYALCVEGKGENKILALYLANPILSKYNTDKKSIQSFLKRHLPSYMTPSKIQLTSKIPYTSSGKVDRKKLKAENRQQRPSEKVFKANHDELERKLIHIVNTLLNTSMATMEDDFFDLGGTSLNLLTLTALIEQHFELKIDPSLLYGNSSLSMIIHLIRNRSEALEEKLFIEFNPEGQKTIFCFPPASGYAFVYKEIASYFPEYRFIAFNFFYRQDLYSIYADEILKYNQASYQLLGYSGGGNIAFNVSKFIESKGKKITDIIMIDAYSRVSTLSEYSDIIINLKSRLIDETRLKYEKIGVASDHIIEKINSYYDFFWKESGDNGKVESNIYLIMSNERNLIELVSKDSNAMSLLGNWKQLTKGTYKEIEGFGKHQYMMDSPAIQMNAKIVKILFQRVFESSKRKAK